MPPGVHCRVSSQGDGGDGYNAVNKHTLGAGPVRHCDKYVAIEDC